jgi:hypothetical protein
VATVRPYGSQADRNAAYRSSRNECVEFVRRLCAAPVLLTVFAAAKLAALGCIDAPKPDADAVNFQRIAINDAGLPGHVVGQGNPARK